jgi:hypothetical protein
MAHSSAPSNHLALVINYGAQPVNPKPKNPTESGWSCFRPAQLPHSLSVYLADPLMIYSDEGA